MNRVPATAIALLALLAVLAPATALGHGEEEAPDAPAEAGVAISGEEAEDAEMEELARQPARILAQQALAMLEVLGDDVEAGERLNAALESDDRDDVDVEVLAAAGRALERGDAGEAILLIDESLSRPLGADQGKALHEAGREYRPATGAQEIVGIIAGGALLLAGLLGLLLGRRPATSVH